ncbi:hypothetical protein FRZ67_10925 [Panacibacter ginsenosidivorans]|uniref:Zn-dependent protease n=1 Tax=Panacibacter ginsenosidivorans TaxID=1813871 RepID=A0A5B8VA21_9BACT|nr:archaemetzincin [Panacibacter ginsenosidivorans]QEC67783.1 hypothetical protein FRZ67_10925 [Panacibacter ginsenosidivorans]
MLNQSYTFKILWLCIIFSSCLSSNPYESAQQKLAPIYPFKKPAQKGDWLYTRIDKYQSLNDYIKSKPTSTDSIRKKIYIMLIGDFDSTQKEIVTGTAEYLHAFYGLQIDFIEMRKDADIFANSRKHPTQGQLQLSAKQIMNVVLKPQLPKDAATLIALTNYDLYPENSWSYIFGLGSTKERVGVWSMYRFGDPHKKEQKEQCLMFTIKTATHEIGHMFSLPHCAKYECCMNGSNSLRELNSHPTYFCPDCLAKICWNLNQDVHANLERTENFWLKRNNVTAKEVYQKSIERLSK